MSDPLARGIALDTCVETAEGPLPMAETPGKGFAVLTRLPSGALGFRQLIKVVTHEGVPLVRVRLDSGHAVVVARRHPFVRADGAAVAAEDLRAGDRLETAFAYPAGYVPPDAPAARPSPSIAVTAVEPAGDGAVMTGTVRDTHTLFLTAGVLCGE